MTRKDTFPCRDCQERSAGCHSVCQKYKEARDEFNRAKQERKEINKWLEDYEDFKIPTVIRTRDKSRRRR